MRALEGNGVRSFSELEKGCCDSPQSCAKTLPPARHESAIVPVKQAGRRACIASLWGSTQLPNDVKRADHAGKYACLIHDKQPVQFESRHLGNHFPCRVFRPDRNDCGCHDLPDIRRTGWLGFTPNDVRTTDNTNRTPASLMTARALNSRLLRTDAASIIAACSEMETGFGVISSSAVFASRVKELIFAPRH